MPRYRSPTTPMHHQVEYLRRVKQRPTSPSPGDVFALLAEMGTGKSKAILDEWQERVGTGETKDLVVIAPSGSYRNWFEDKSADQLSELNAHLDPELREKMLVASWESRAGANHRRHLERVVRSSEPDRPRALFVNVEALSTVDDAVQAIRFFLETSRGRSMIVIDESTRIKGRSNRTAAALTLGQIAGARRIMTGMVTPRSPLDLFYQFEFLDWRILGFQNFYVFRNRYAVLKRMDHGGRKFDVVVGYKNIEELNEKIAPYSYRVLKEDCLDLPKKVYTMRSIELTPEQRRHYKEIKNYATTQLSSGSFVTAGAVINQITRLHQITIGHVKDENGIIHDIPSNRLRALVEVLDEHPGKAIVWTDSVHELKKIVAAINKEFGDGCAAAFWGENAAARGGEERRWLGDPSCRFMISTPQAGGIGNTWNAASLVVYYSNSYDLELRAQSEDRCHRRGQDKSVTYVDLVAEGTVDTVILKSLRKKIDMSTAITGENYREWLI